MCIILCLFCYSPGSGSLWDRSLYPKQFLHDLYFLEGLSCQPCTRLTGLASSDNVLPVTLKKYHKSLIFFCESISQWLLDRGHSKAFVACSFLNKYLNLFHLSWQCAVQVLNTRSALQCPSSARSNFLAHPLRCGTMKERDLMNSAMEFMTSSDFTSP